MAITTSGGSGSGTTAVTSAAGGTAITLFTTPNTANALFIVNYTLCGREDYPMWSGQMSNGSHVAVTTDAIQAHATGSASSGGTIKVGPNTAVVVRALYATGTTSVVGWAYNYVGLIFS